MTGRLRDMAKGLAGSVGLLLLLVGPPLALAHFVGWPLPTTVPSVDEIGSAARSGIDDMVVVKVLAVLAWLCWAQIALAATVEMAALARGRAARRAPVFAGVQICVGRLVATAALVVASWGTQRTAAVPMPVARLAALVAEPAPAGARPEPAPALVPRLVATSTDGAVSGESGRSYVVKRNDSWWAIAERTLGDGRRWKDLRDANLGRTMPDGTVISPDSELIRPGWELLLTGDPVSAPPVSSNGHVDEVEVRPGDNLWVMAERHLQEATGEAVAEADVRGHWETVIDINRDRLADPGNPSRIYAGQQMRMPSVSRFPAAPPSGEAPATPTAAPPSVPGSAPIPARPDSPPTTTASARAVPTSAPSQAPASAPVAGPRPAPVEGRTADRTGGVPASVLGTASTVLAVGIAAALTRRRRRRQLHLPARAQVPMPPPELDGLRAAMVVNGDVDQVTRLHRALRDIATALGARRSDARPRVVQVTGARIEALLSQAVVPAPKPWRTEASGVSWELKGEPLDRDEDGIASNPALVTIGRPDPDTELYLDLEAEGVVSLVGPADDVGDVARSWVLELATSPMADGISVVVIGESLAPASDVSDRVHCVDTWGEL